MASLEHETALVTVASRRAGRGIALALATAGATVYLSGRTVESAVLPECEALSGRPPSGPELRRNAADSGSPRGERTSCLTGAGVG
jgi:NAD(P)-dependent dehydrogenase (short-subunit alcohol dehydrogenase family)